MLSYNKITLYGNSLTDYVWTTDDVKSQAFIDSTTGYNFAPIWEGNTLLLAPFTEGIGGGNIISLNEPIVSWLVYKKKPTDTILTFVAQVPANQTKIIDYNIEDNSEYQYTLFAVTKNYMSAPMVSQEYVKAFWDSWSIVGLQASADDKLYYVDTDNVWLFNTQLASNPLVQNVDKYQFDNFTQFPKVASGAKNYITGGISAFINNVKDGKYYDTITMQRNFAEFINSKGLKLLKDRKGNVLVVETMTNEFKYIDNSSEQITSVNFTFTQVDSNISFSTIERG